MLRSQLVILRAELDAGHPGTGAYDANNNIAADQINAENRAVANDSLSGRDFKAAIDATEFDGLTDAQKQLAFTMFNNDSLDASVGSVDRQTAVTLFAGMTNTLAALSTLQTKNISRAAELGLGTVLVGDVQAARAL
jgi:hypothetical protein